MLEANLLRDDFVFGASDHKDWPVVAVHQVDVVQIDVLADRNADDAGQAGGHDRKGELQDVVKCSVENLAKQWLMKREGETIVTPLTTPFTSGYCVAMYREDQPPMLQPNIRIFSGAKPSL